MTLDNLHAALAASFEDGAETPTAEASAEPSETTAVPEGQEPSPQPVDDQALAGSPPASEQSQGAERARGPDGKFTKATPQVQPKPTVAAGAAPVAAKGQPPAPGKAPQQAAPGASPAPRTWAPAAREHWANLPREVKDQVLKMEGLATRHHTELQQVKQVHQRFQEALQPFMPHLQALGVEPAAAVREMFQMEYQLRSGNPGTKAGMIAHLMERYNVPVEALAATLEGKPPPQTQQPVQDPRVDQLFGHLQQLNTRRQGEATAKASAELQAFEATNPEFLDDVAPEMADLISLARKSGKPVNLQQIYDKACLLNENVRTVLEQRRAQETQRAQQQKAAQARYVAGSVQSEPAPPAGGKRPGLAGMFDALAQNLGG